VENWARWKQIFLVVVMIIFFPVTLCVLIAVYLCGIGFGALVGFLCGPCLINQSCDCECVFGICCCPLLMVVGAIIGFFGSIGYGAYLFAQALK